MKDFFISYTKADLEWAQRIDTWLRDAGHTTIVQFRDFAPGKNFVGEMHRALQEAKHVVALLSHAYLTASPFGEAEWAAGFVRDPTGREAPLIPVRVQECKPPGLLAAIVYIDLVGKGEDAAHAELLAGIGKALATAPEAKPPAQPIWHVPYHRNSHFTGREEVLTALRAQLEASGSAAITQVLHGLGGIGKTQTALEYCYRHREKYSVVWWLPAEEKAPLLQAYADLAPALGLPPASEQLQQIEAVRRWLAQHENWLLIFDNAEAPEAIVELLPTNGAGHVLITSRNSLWRDLTKPLALPTLPRAESVAFIIKRLEKATLAEADELAELVGDLPLALAQAVGYIEATGKRVAAYINLFRQEQRYLLAKKAAELPAYAESIATAWALALERLPVDAPLAVQLLTLCAYLAPDAIAHDLLQAYVAEQAGEARAEVALDEALIALRLHSLLRVDDGSVAIHRLVQAVVRQRLTDEEQARWAQEAVALIQGLFPADVATPAHWPRWAALLPHALAAAELARTAAPDGVVEMLDWVGLYLDHAGAYGAARETLQQALDVCRAAGLEPLTEARLLQHLATACWHSGAYPAAYEHAQAALRSFVAACAPEDLRIARARIWLASCAVKCAAWEEGRAAAALALQRVDEVADEAQLDGADLHNLAVVYDQLSDYATALRLYQRALTLDERRYSATHPTYIATLGHIGNTLYRLRRLTAAHEAAASALKLAATAYPPDHPSLAHCHNTLGLVLAGLGELVAAREAFEKALSIAQKALGPAHPSVAVTLSNLAYACLEAGDAAAAKGHGERALQINLQCYPEESEQVQAIRRLLALIQAVLAQHAQPKWRRGRRR